MATLNRVLDYIVNTSELGSVLGGHGGIMLPIVQGIQALQCSWLRVGSKW